MSVLQHFMAATGAAVWLSVALVLIVYTLRHAVPSIRKAARRRVRPNETTKGDIIRRDVVWRSWGSATRINHRVVVFWANGVWVAQGVVLDLRAQGATVDEAIQKYQAALAQEMQTHASPAFVPDDLFQHFQEKWGQGEQLTYKPLIRVVPKP